MAQIRFDGDHLDTGIIWRHHLRPGKTEPDKEVFILYLLPLPSPNSGPRLKAAVLSCSFVYCYCLSYE